jgi:hypothetical protein
VATQTTSDAVELAADNELVEVDLSTEDSSTAK